MVYWSTELKSYGLLSTDWRVYKFLHYLVPPSIFSQYLIIPCMNQISQKYSILIERSFFAIISNTSCFYLQILVPWHHFCYPMAVRLESIYQTILCFINSHETGRSLKDSIRIQRNFLIECHLSIMTVNMTLESRD